VKVLVTGGAGFIGSHLSDLLVANDNEVVVLDNLSTGRHKNISQLTKNIEMIQGDIRDSKVVEKVTKKVDLVLHMAAALGVKNILENPIDSISTNFYGSETVLKAASKFDKRIIIASTSEIYGKNLKQPLNENDDRVIGSPQKLRWTYSDAKALEEAVAHSLFKSDGLAVTIVRLFNTVGPRQTGKYGMVVPRFIESAMKNDPVKVFGDGLQTRVFCHVLDTTEAIVKLALNSNSIGEVFNIGGTEEISILELARTIILELKSKSPIDFINYQDAYPYGFDETKRRVPDISKIRDLINWTPKRDLTTVIKDIRETYAK
jgi:UDP-glucose 4-epimerase